MASTSTQLSKRNSQQEPPDNRSVYDTLSKRELLGIQRYNDGIIREKFAKGVEVSKSIYLQQVLAEQQQIEARLAILEQLPEDKDVYLRSLPPLSEYILSVKARAARTPVVFKGRNQYMSIEDAAIIEKQHAEAQKRKPNRPKGLDVLSEKEKHAVIMEYMNYRGSEDEEDDDDGDGDSDEYWFKDGEMAEDAGAVGGEWTDPNDLSHMIAVDTDRIAAGGFYTNFVEDP